VAEALAKEEDALVALVNVAQEVDKEAGALRAAEMKAKQAGIHQSKEVQALFSQVKEEMRKGGFGGTPVHDLAVSILGNVCLEPCGKQVVQQSKALTAVKSRIRQGVPVESVANLLVNIVSTDAKGAAVSEAAAKIALVPLFEAVEEELASAKNIRQHSSERLSKVVGALHNLGATSSAVRGMMIGRDKVPVVRKLIEVPGTAGLRACGLLVKLLHEAPTCVPRHHMTPLLCELSRQLTLAKHDPQLPEVDALVRLFGVLFAKTVAINSLLDEEAEGCAEISIGTLVAQLLQVVKRAQPAAYASAKPTQLSALRGNLALVVAELASQQMPADAPAPVRELDLGPFVEPMILMLRKEVGGAQHNCGVAVTKLALVERYKPLVRTLKGFESLHQISMRAHQKNNQALSAAFRQ
jgi:hypothetical protein